MEQVIHIFRKDVRHLWPYALTVLILVIVHAVLDVRSLPGQIPEKIRTNMLASTLDILLPLCIWLLIAWVIFEETIPGDGQFWLTRRYSWPKLLASKILFVLVFVNAPLFLSDCYILAAQGFPVLSVLPRLLLRQVFMTVLFVLPSFAIATVTTGISQFFMAWFILLLAIVSEVTLASTLFHTNGIAVDGGWGLIAPLVVATCAIVIWHYARRRTNPARLLLLTTVCVLPVAVPAAVYLIASLRPVAAAHPIPSLANGPDVQISYDLGRKVPSGAGWQTQREVEARIPLKVTGLPPKTLLRGSALNKIGIAGTEWTSRENVVFSSVERMNGGYWQIIHFRAPRVNILKEHPASLHTLFDLEIVSDEIQTRVPSTKTVFYVSGVGLCHTLENTSTGYQLTCRAGLEPTIETAFRLHSPQGSGQELANFQPRPVPWGLSPASDLGPSSNYFLERGAELTFTPRRIITRLQRTLDLPGIELSEYMLPAESGYVLNH